MVLVLHIQIMLQNCHSQIQQMTEPVGYNTEYVSNALSVLSSVLVSFHVNELQ